MLRIKDPAVTLPFYTENFGMQLVHQYDFPQWKFSLYFLERVQEGVQLPAPGTKESEEYLWSMQGTTLELTHNHGTEHDDSFSVWSGNKGSDLPQDSPLFMEEARAFVKTLWQPVLELTHNHGTEDSESFAVHTGNSDPVGFGHIGFLVDDLAACCAEMEGLGVSFHKRPQDGNMQQLAFALDPDGYRVELVQRGSTFAGVCSNF